MAQAVDYRALSLNRNSSRRQSLTGSEGLFGKSLRFSRGPAQDDEEALMWAALEKLPTYDRLRTGILKNYSVGGHITNQEVDITEIGFKERQELIDRLLKVADEDNEKILQRLRLRIDRVGIDMPTVEVRYENLNIQAKCYVGERALPTLINTARNMFESILRLVGVSGAKKVTINILKGVSGIIKPGRMTLLLGPPGSGKTTLLLALANKLDKDLQIAGKVTYNGHGLDEFVPQKTSAYISQHDLHIGEMTVRETLEFSARCQGVGSRQDLISEVIKRERDAGITPEPELDIFMKASALEEVQSKVMTAYTLKILDLDICADTMVGDSMRRGISGGQKKRVTTGEMVVGPTKTLFMDNISTGLDSSTTYQIIKSFQHFVHVMESTAMISLLQPAPETYNLFDDIVLLSEGQVVYHGPREYILDFFETCGFKCPDRKGHADFLQEVTSRKDQEQYWLDKRRPYQYVSVENFATRFKDYHVGKKLLEELSSSFDKETSHKAALVYERYAARKKDLFKILFDREVLLFKRNSFIYIFRLLQVVFVAFVSMTVFLRTRLHQRSVNDANLYLGSLFFGLITAMFNGFAELALTLNRLPVFYKQRDLLFYPAWAYSLPTYVLSIPIALAESSVWVLMTYFVTGFTPEAGRFFRQILVLFLVHQMATSAFRLLAGVFRTMVLANAGGSFIVLVFLILGGFIIPKDSIPKWWIWGFWISPLQYAENAISINELLSSRWNKGSANIGIQALEAHGLFTRGYWYWIDISALIGFIVLFNILFTLAITYLNPLGKSQAIVSEETLAEISSSAQGTTYDTQKLSKRKSKRGPIDRDLYPSPQDLLSNPSISGTTADINEIRQGKGMILHFEPLSVCFENINYYVDMPVEMRAEGEKETRLQLLQDITGYFRPGVLTSLMGVSGAGKTTLMDVLAGRKTSGYVEGSIHISGFPKQQETFTRVSGYCEQNDIHSPQLTVYESLVFSGWTRLSASIDKETKMHFVDEVMNLVELGNLRDAIVGLPGVTGLSTEQRKRLTIAVELVANPSIIFMDEPTSGLDARAAAIVMRAIRNTVDTGRTVVCTIHQPSIDIFEAFDELLLLKRGGQIIYTGPLGRQSHQLVEYFEAIPGIPKITEGYNPATWMLEITSSSMEQQIGVDFAEIYQQSALFQRNKDLVKELSVPAPDAKALYFPTEYSLSTWEQLKCCLWKHSWTYWRSPEYTFVKLVFSLAAALIFGTIFWRVGQKWNEQKNIYTVFGALYSAVIFLGIANCSSVQPVVDTERTVFYRERAAGMYSALPYAVSQVMIEIPYVFAQTIIYGCITYAMINFEWTLAKFCWYIFFLFFTLLYFTYYGMLAVAITPSFEVAAIVASAFYSLFNLFSGFMISKPQIPKWWIWYYYICPVAWTIYGLIGSQYGDINKPMVQNDGSTILVKTFVEDTFGFHHDFLGVVAVVVIGFATFFAFMFAVCLKYLNFQQR